MNLIKDHWTKQDIKDFHEYEKSFIGNDKDCQWEQRIINTKLKCYAQTSSKARKIVKEIKKGNYVEFIDNLDIQTHLDSICFCMCLNLITDISILKKYLDKFSLTIDNWASCDTLKFDRFLSNNVKALKSISNEYINSKLTFKRRIGIIIYFDLIKDEIYLEEAFKMIDSLIDESEYYVNMCAAWLLSVCMVQYRDQTIKYLASNRTNSFIINKAIQKCRDSFRVSNQDKDFILKFKK